MKPKATIKANIAMPKTMAKASFGARLSLSASTRERARMVIKAKQMTKKTKSVRERKAFRASWDLLTLCYQFSFLEQAHFPGQALRRDIHKRHHLVVLKNMRHSWHWGKQNSIDEWSEVKQGEQCGREQGGGIEVNVPGNRVSVFKKVKKKSSKIVYKKVQKKFKKRRWHRSRRAWQPGKRLQKS